MSITLKDSHSISAEALKVLQDDASLPICTACGTQFPAPRSDNCPICEDRRQAVPASGQTWTTLADLSTSRTISVTPDASDSRISHISVNPPFAINQTPFLIETAGGSYIWDCAATITPALISHLRNLRSPLKAIAISHPHFFTTSLTWTRALQVPLYLCESDREWYQRAGDIRPGDDVRWWSDEEVLGDGVKIIQCGGHFPGSSVLYWDRINEPAPSPLPTKPTPVSGILLVSDTVFVQATQKGFTFIWSVPNLVPLNPKDTIAILRKLEPLAFNEAASQFPNRWIRNNAKQILLQSARAHLKAMGWKLEGYEYSPDDGA